jgi:hypothetical protein
MSRKLLFSVAVVLFLSSGALACVGYAQYFSQGLSQGFSIDAANVVARTGGVGSAVGSNAVTIGHSQAASSVASGTSAFQQETATLTQSGKAVGAVGTTAVVQNATVTGAQNQNAGVGWPARGTRSGGQSLGVNLGMVTSNSRGIGGAVGSQRFVGSQSQTQVTPNGISTASQYIDATQLATVSGGAASVTNSLDVKLNQSSAVVTGGK